MSEKITFAAQARTALGKKSKLLRKQKQIPANVFGDIKESVPVAVDEVAFKHLYHKVGDTGLFYLKIEGEKADRPVLVDEVQADPLTRQILHVSFHQVSLSEKVTAEVPVVTIGEFAVKNALVVTVHSTIEVEALPQDLPEKFEIDLSKFTAVDQMVTFNQLSYDKSKVELQVDQSELDTPVIMVQAVKEEVVEAPAPVAPAEAAPSAEAAEKPAETPKSEDKK